MNGLTDFLDDFGVATRVSDIQPTLPDEADLENQRLEAYESGYKAGWDDALSAQSQDSVRLSGALAQQLQDLSFTYQEAHGHMINAMTPLLEDVVKVLLPGMAQAALGQHVIDQLGTMAREIGTLDVEIAVAPGNIDAVSPLIDGDFNFPVRLVADDTLSEDQADLRFGKTEKQIDLGELLGSITEALDGFMFENQRKIANG